MVLVKYIRNYFSSLLLSGTRLDSLDLLSICGCYYMIYWFEDLDTFRWKKKIMEEK